MNVHLFMKQGYLYPTGYIAIPFRIDVFFYFFVRTFENKKENKLFLLYFSTLECIKVHVHKSSFDRGGE
jgi:hypothetical protein